MDDLIKALEKMRREMLLMRHEVDELQAKNKHTLPDGWRIISGGKKRINLQEGHFEEKLGKISNS